MGGVSKKSSSTRCNTFLIDLDRKAKDKYDSLPAKSILKHPDSFVSQRIVYLEAEVLALYKLSSERNKDIQEFFTTLVKLDIPGIYCFISKNRSPGGAGGAPGGSSVNMKRRFNRHQNNLNSKVDRSSQANPKFYNFVRKYGWESLEFGCLLETKDYLVMFSGFDLSPEEISLLKILTQLDLLITEQYFLDSVPPGGMQRAHCARAPLRFISKYIPSSRNQRVCHLKYKYIFNILLFYK